MMRALVIGRSYPHDRRHILGTFELTQARALAALGVDVVYSFIDRRPLHVLRSIGRKSLVDQPSGIPVRGFDLPLKGLPRSLVQASRTRVWNALLRDVETEIGPIDVAYAHYPAITLTPGFNQSLRRRSIPLVAMEHWTRILDGTIPRRFKSTLLDVAREARVFGCVSEDLAEAVREQVGTGLAGELVVIPNIVPDIFQAEPQPSLPNRDPTFIAIGRLVPVKHFDQVVQAFSELPVEQSKLVIVGDGPERHTLERLARACGVADRVHFTGMLTSDEVAESLSNADCYVSASSLETFGVPIVESWLAGVPAIARSSNPLRSFFNGTNGWMYDPEAPRSLTSVMETFIEQRGEIDSVAIRSFALNRFGQVGVAEQVLHALHAAIGEEE